LGFFLPVVYLKR